MPVLEFTWSSRDLAMWRGGKVEKALAQALSKAGGGAARAMKAESSRQIRERKRFRAWHVNRALPLTFPTSKEITRLAWRMDVSGAPVPVAAFSHRQTRRGVSVAINKGSRSLIRSAFIATMASGHKGVFTAFGPKRIIGRGTYAGAFRRPIREAFTTRVSDVFNDSGFIPRVQRRAQGVFARDFERLLPMELRKLKGAR